MPDGDITHPIPDLAGYITEGQIVLSRELQRRGVWPPIDVLPSLSRLMNGGIGAAHTVPEHRRWADQLYALYARGREARLMVAIVGEAGLPASGWRLLDRLPSDDLLKLSGEALSARAQQRRTAGGGQP
jgi:V/A-type H+-transporting ATPase subunit B